MTYLSFYDGYSITLMFQDESIINGEGDDIFITTYGKSNVHADIYVSSDDHHYDKLGVLHTDESISSYDLSNINRSEPVTYIKFDFFNTQENKHVHSPLNIVNVRINKDSIYLPPYSYKVNIPKAKSVMFINDCNHELPCGWYCDFNYLSDDHYFSCLTGCNSIRKHDMCMCEDINLSFIEFGYYDDDFSWFDDFEYNFGEHFCNRVVITNYKVDSIS